MRPNQVVCHQGGKEGGKKKKGKKRRKEPAWQFYFAHTHISNPRDRSERRKEEREKCDPTIVFASLFIMRKVLKGKEGKEKEKEGTNNSLVVSMSLWNST